MRWRASFGVRRVTLARELSLDEIRAIAAQTDCELEIFVHGALCVAYSGQCFSSEAWGGRSANRGQCAQACRLPYEMLVDGRVEPLGDARYLLSPGDLFALRQVPEIVDIGIAALKIEGRYKDADYVALTTRAYRKAVDDAWAGRAVTVTPADRNCSSSRSIRAGWDRIFLTGTNHQAVVQRPRAAPSRRAAWDAWSAWIAGPRYRGAQRASHDIAPLKAGDGVVFDAADWRSPQEPEEGGRVYEALPVSTAAWNCASPTARFDFARIRPGDLVWRTHDPEPRPSRAAALQAAAPVARQPVHVRVDRARKASRWGPSGRSRGTRRRA